MVDRNDFKLLKQRCLRHFELAKEYLGDKKLDLDDNQKARYGFYFFVIQNLTNLVDYDKMVDAITDTDLILLFSMFKMLMRELMLYVLMSKNIL